MSYGEELQEINEELNLFMETGRFSEKYSLEEMVSGKEPLKQMIEEAAGCLSKELLYMKFLQGIPLVGVAGGAYDAIYLKKIVEYAKMKYQRRFLLGRIKDR